jgi:vancomycin aglycone glucosyltransferase
MRGDTPAPALESYDELWARDRQRWNDGWAAPLNRHREALGLDPVTDVLGHILGDRPWLASDPPLAPWPDPTDDGVFRSGAWILPDERPLSRELEAFLDAGEPPIYFGFGSISAPHDLAATMIASARALGRRAIVSRGWADLALVDDAPDCIAIGEVNQQALFPRVAAVVHHGGAGTTTAAARAGAPQVVIPQHYDQHYFAQRVEVLGIGKMHAARVPTTDSLTSALTETFAPDVAERARSVASRIRGDGAEIAARRLIDPRAPSLRPEPALVAPLKGDAAETRADAGRVEEGRQPEVK